MDKRKYILIIDDSIITLKQAQEMLKNDFRLAMCKSGSKGLDFIRNNDEKPDLILLDINMPEQNGYEIMEQLLEDEVAKKIPVVFLTGDVNIENEVKGLRMGAMDFIHKPFVPEIVLSRINRILEVTELREKLEGQVENKTKELEQLSEYTNEIQIMARTDGLTGIFNRSYFEDMANEYIDGISAGCLFMIDLDNFKSINDSYGHIAGDEVLKLFAENIMKNIDGKGIIGRIGGDEFIAVSGKCKTRDEAARLAQDFLSDINAIKFKFSDELTISASIGIANYPDDGKNLLDLYNNADKALYYVKQNGKNNYHFYSEENVQSDKNTSIQADLDAIKLIMGDKHNSTGAYLVEYDGFKKIYHFLERVVERTKENFQILLFTLTKQDGSVPESDVLEDAMEKVHHIIANYLRKGDVATSFSSCQYIVILSGANNLDAINVAQRILNVYSNQVINSDLIIKYDCREIEAGGNEDGTELSDNS